MDPVLSNICSNTCGICSVFAFTGPGFKPRGAHDSGAFFWPSVLLSNCWQNCRSVTRVNRNRNRHSGGGGGAPPHESSESSHPTQHAKGRTGDRPGPRKGATTRRNVTQGDPPPHYIHPCPPPCPPSPCVTPGAASGSGPSASSRCCVPPLPLPLSVPLPRPQAAKRSRRRSRSSLPYDVRDWGPAPGAGMCSARSRSWAWRAAPTRRWAPRRCLGSPEGNGSAPPSAWS